MEEVCNLVNASTGFQEAGNMVPLNQSETALTKRWIIIIITVIVIFVIFSILGKTAKNGHKASKYLLTSVCL